MTPTAVKVLRKSLGLTQQAFADILGLSFVSINKWENHASAPTGLSEVMLELLSNVLSRHPAELVLANLRRCKGVPIDVVRTLTRMERAHA